MAGSLQFARRLGAALVLCGLVMLLARPAQALSLGEPLIDSFLAEPLRARLPVDGKAPGIHSLRARMLPPSAYARLGLFPPAHPLEDFQIELEGDSVQGYWFNILSREAIREPILSILLRIEDKERSLVRQIHLVLDQQPLPRHSSIAAASPSQSTPMPTTVPAADRPDPSPVTATAPAAHRPSAEVDTPDPFRLPELQPILSATKPGAGPAAGTPAAPPLPEAESAWPVPQPILRQARASAPAPPVPTESQTYGPIKAGEVLSRISQIVRPTPSISIHKMSAALYALNPQAFRGGPHTLILGALLRVPSAEFLRDFEDELDWYTPTRTSPKDPGAQTPPARTQTSPARPETPFTVPASLESLNPVPR